MSSGRTFLVTGAAGFIGSHVTEGLLRRGDRVIGLDNFDDFYDPRVKRANVRWACEQPGYHLVEGDIRDEASVDTAFGHGPVEGVIHLAARAGVRPSIRQPLLYDDVNVRGTTTMLEAARRHGVEHFVHGSSSSVYGSSCPVPFRESDAADRPSSPYAATKRANELTCHSYHHVYGLDVTCLRFFTVYGPRQRPEMAIHKFTRLIDRGEQVELYGNGSSQRDYTYIDDIVLGVLAAADRPDGYRIYNLGTTAVTRLDDLVEMIAKRLDKPLRARYLPDQPGDVPITYADISEAQAGLDYDVTTPFDEGLDAFIGWYRRAASLKGRTAA